MKSFPHFNSEGKCIVCGKNGDGETILIPIDGTEKDHNEQAEQCHVDCISLRYNRNVGVLYQKL